MPGLSPVRSYVSASCSSIHADVTIGGFDCFDGEQPDIAVSQNGIGSQLVILSGRLVEPTRSNVEQCTDSHDLPEP